MDNTKILEMLNGGQIEELKGKIQDEIHAIAKKRAIKIIAEEYKNIVLTNVYKALINYRVPDIKDE